MIHMFFGESWGKFVKLLALPNYCAIYILAWIICKEKMKLFWKYTEVD